MEFNIYTFATLGSVLFLVTLGVYNIIRYKMYRSLIYSVVGFLIGLFLGSFLAYGLLSGLPPNTGLGGALFLILVLPIPLALGLFFAATGAFLGRRINKE